MLLKLADAIDADADDLAKLESEDVGKPISVSCADIPFIADNLRFFAGAARGPGGQVRRRVRDGVHEHDPPRAARRHGRHLPRGTTR